MYFTVDSMIISSWFGRGSFYYKRIWKIEWEREDLALAIVDPVALFLKPTIRISRAYSTLLISTVIKSGI